MRKFKTLLFPILTLAALLTMTGFFLARNRPGAGPVRTQHPAAEPEEFSPLNLNTATAEELEKLPAIGAVRAQNIVSDREANGPFRTVEDVMRVSGIGNWVYQQIYELVYVEDEHENRDH